jgi:hypothetical protein
VEENPMNMLENEKTHQDLVGFDAVAWSRWGY